MPISVNKAIKRRLLPAVCIIQVFTHGYRTLSNSYKSIKNAVQNEINEHRSNTCNVSAQSRQQISTVTKHYKTCGAKPSV